MYEELIRRLQDFAAGTMRDADAQLAFEAAGAIEELQAQLMYSNDAAKTIAEKVPRWIPVTERLPEEEEVVLVWGGASVYTAKRHNKYQGLMWWKLNSKQHYCNPTHWMPLPEPPESEGE